MSRQKEHFSQYLERIGPDKRKMCKSLGIAHKTLYSRLSNPEEFSIGNIIAIANHFGITVENAFEMLWEEIKGRSTQQQNSEQVVK